MSKSQYDWDCYHLNTVKAASIHYSCRRAPVGGLGAILVRDNRQLVSGYTGSIPGTPHCTDPVANYGGCLPGEDGGCQRTIHAEMNALAVAARHGVSIDGATCYCTMSPCVMCFKTLMAAGIRRFVFMEQYRIFGIQSRLVAGSDVSVQFTYISREEVSAYAASQSKNSSSSGSGGETGTSS